MKRFLKWLVGEDPAPELGLPAQPMFAVAQMQGERVVEGRR